MWYLVLYIIGQGSAVAIIPEKYSTEEACHSAAKPNRWSHSCIQAPEVTSNILQNVPQYDKDGNLKVTPGYFCGQYPDKCKIPYDSYNTQFCTQTGNNPIVCKSGN